MNAKKTKSGLRAPRRKPAAQKQVSLVKQIASLRRELREVKEQRDCFAKAIARLMRPEIEEVLSKESDLLQYVGQKPTVAELLKEMTSGAAK